MLPIRLAVIGSYVPDGVVVADIGCDHALLPIDLITRGQVGKAIATDLNKGPLEAARRRAEKHGIPEDKLELRLGNGLQVLKPGEASVVTIAGMGGVLIADILQAVPEVTSRLKRLIVSPNNAPWRIREWAAENAFDIVAEEVVLDRNRFYEVLVLEPGIMATYSEEAMYFGPCLLRARDPATEAYYAFRRAADLQLIEQWQQVKEEHPELQQPLTRLTRLWQEWEALRWS